MSATIIQGDLRKVLSRQMFFWGRDIAEAQGNLLLDFGFTKLAHDDDPRAGYTMPWESGAICLQYMCLSFVSKLGGEMGFVFTRNPRRVAGWMSTEIPVQSSVDEKCAISLPTADLVKTAAPFLRWNLAYEKWRRGLTSTRETREVQDKLYMMQPGSIDLGSSSKALGWLEKLVAGELVPLRKV